MSYNGLSSIGEQRAFNELLNALEEGLNDSDSFPFGLMAEMIHDYEEEGVVPIKKGTINTKLYLLRRLKNLFEKYRESILPNTPNDTEQNERIDDFFFNMFDKLANDVFDNLTTAEKFKILSMYFK